MTLRDKVTANLVKWGNNPQEVTDMVNKHFDQAATQHDTPKSIANFIRTIY